MRKATRLGSLPKSGFSAACRVAALQRVSCVRKRTNVSTLAERFWSKVLIIDDADSCWLWQAGSFGVERYGAFWTGERNEGAHIVSYKLKNGPVPDGLFVLHKCDNPPCVRPSHLYVGTPQQNMTDKSNRGRTPLGEAHILSKLTSDDVLRIRETCQAGQSQRSVARKFGIGQTQVWRIVNGESWTHLPEVKVVSCL